MDRNDEFRDIYISYREKTGEKKQNYFDETLANFTHDVASYGAIRHMVRKDYTLKQILENLSFPTPRTQVEQVVYQTLVKDQIILEDISFFENSEYQKEIYTQENSRKMLERICLLRQENQQKNSYVVCPYGTWQRDRSTRLNAVFSCLTSRERDYMEGIPWPMHKVCYQLNSRMHEISMQMLRETKQPMEYVFLKSKVIVIRADKT